MVTNINFAPKHLPISAWGGGGGGGGGGRGPAQVLQLTINPAVGLEVSVSAEKQTGASKCATIQECTFYFLLPQPLFCLRGNR